MFSITERILFKWKSDFKATGRTEPKKRKTPPRKPIISDLKVFSEFVEKKPDRTQSQMAEEWGGISQRAISDTLTRAGFIYKKTFDYRQRNEKKRNEFVEIFSTYENYHLIYLDESGIRKNEAIE